MASADAVLLIAFGGPTRPEEIRPFLENVTRGRRIPPERLEEVAHHYELIGGRSPLNELTFRQAEALRRTPGAPPVYVGMRNWEPYLADDAGADGARRRAARDRRDPGPARQRVEPRALHGDRRGGPAALGPRAPGGELRATRGTRIRSSSRRSPSGCVRRARRCPRRCARAPRSSSPRTASPSPPRSSRRTSRRSRPRRARSPLRLDQTRWEIAYQSRSGNPRDPWLEPDINATLERLAGEGARAVVVEPIGFVCDHVEVLYDLDVEARATAARHGLAWARAGTVNDHPLFIRMLAEVVRDHAA